MRVSISNIAWDPADDAGVAELLRRHGVSAIDVAPPKYFPDPVKASRDDIATVRDAWESRGLGVVGMQSLLFGTSGLNLFGDAEVQARMLDHLDAVCAIGAGLGASRLVFGSPKNRDRSALADGEAERTALRFFARLGEVAAGRGVTICLEPNPPEYGCNFLVSTAEAGAFVRRLGHAAVRLQLDVGAATMAGEDPESVVSEFADQIGHVHASEPGLAVLGDGLSDHAGFAAALRRYRPDLTVAIEMLVPAGRAVLEAIDHAVALAVAHYGERSVLR
jgi:D-psicose/D-tagatose/L-ribulose 3-epimerase